MLFKNYEIVSYKVKIFESRVKEGSEDLIQTKSKDKKQEKVTIEEDKRGNLKEQVLKAFNSTEEAQPIDFSSFQIMRLRGKVYLALLSPETKNLMVISKDLNFFNLFKLSDSQKVLGIRR